MIHPLQRDTLGTSRSSRHTGLMRAGWTAALVWACLASPAAAQSDPECDHLWERRNSIYAAAGYCFKTDRAIAHFGNIGCQYDREQDVPLTRQERREIQAIIRQEKILGCRP